jgi:protoheme IX farnesyltransferase
MFKRYYDLAKPGIVYGNIVTTLAAFLFASRWHIAPLLLAMTIIGLGLVIASACVFNNYIDRVIDGKMERTKNRALVIGTISSRAALMYAAILGAIGFLLLIFEVNILSACVAGVGFFFYVFLYSYAKRAGHLGALVGSVSGAVPILVGYTAVTDRIDATGVLLFLILVMWQMPHFYAIAMNRLADYRAAEIPVLPIEKGTRITKINIVIYIVLFILSICSLALIAHTSYIFLVVVGAASIWWLVKGVRGFTTTDDKKWAKNVFLFSLVTLLVFSFMLSLSSFLP